jgi:hypothetical protein
MLGSKIWNHIQPLLALKVVVEFQFSTILIGNEIYFTYKYK